ncbi:hypothetical protein BS47DRAFT_895463 [Hydnum rufescens UP504]|uniref:Uncharacterized protein n=1 Tax=Hydnum rufescens UP504 TaxID=1448309 RepID=A0A9P6ADC5_9AGAM|nr:hypothetical protein BS47DRAFT_895463 [Hydnum rufescens UP504]
MSQTTRPRNKREPEANRDLPTLPLLHSLAAPLRRTKRNIIASIFFCLFTHSAHGVGSLTGPSSHQDQRSVANMPTFGSRLLLPLCSTASS